MEKLLKNLCKIFFANSCALIFLILLSISFTAHAGFDFFIKGKVEKRANHIINSFEAKNNYAPEYDFVYQEFINNLHLAPRSMHNKIFQALKLVAEHLQSKYSVEQGLAQGRYFEEIAKLTSQARSYFLRTENFSGQKYFDKYNLVITEILSAKLSPIGVPNISNAGVLNVKIFAPDDTEQLEKAYQQFKKDMQTSAQKKNMNEYDYLIEGARSLKNTYLSTHILGKESALSNMDAYAEFSLRYSLETNHIFTIHFFKKHISEINYEEKLLREELQRQSDNDGLNKAKNKFENQVRTNVNEIESNDREYAELSIFETTIKISYRILNTENGNVLAIGSKSGRKKIYLLEVITPSAFSSEAMKIAAETLLQHESVHGVMFENQLKVPSKLNLLNYEIRSLGQGKILLRPRPLVCSALFS